MAHAPNSETSDPVVLAIEMFAKRCLRKKCFWEHLFFVLKLEGVHEKSENFLF